MSEHIAIQGMHIQYHRHTSNITNEKQPWSCFFGSMHTSLDFGITSAKSHLQSLSLSSEEVFFVVGGSESGGEVAEDADESDVVESGKSFVSDFQDHFVIRTKNLFSRYIFVIFITKIIVLRFIRTISFNEA